MDSKNKLNIIFHNTYDETNNNEIVKILMESLLREVTKEESTY